MLYAKQYVISNQSHVQASQATCAMLDTHQVSRLLPCRQAVLPELSLHYEGAFVSRSTLRLRDPFHNLLGHSVKS